MKNILTSSLEDMQKELAENFKQLHPNSERQFMLEYKGWRFYIRMTFGVFGWQVTLSKDQEGNENLFSLMRFGMATHDTAFTQMELDILTAMRTAYKEHLL